MSLFQIFSIFVFVICVKKIECKGELRFLDETSWSDMLHGEWMVEFFAPWCPACQQLQPLWTEFAKWSEDLEIKVGSVDVTLNPGIHYLTLTPEPQDGIRGQGLSGRFMITALPTIFHVKDGVFRQYRGARDKDSFFSFVEEKKWLSLDPVSSWKSPQSMQMSTIAHFFKLSMLLRSLHNTIVQDYGIPYYGSYVIFGFATIIIGTLLGLIIVCILDYFCHSKAADYESLKEPSERDTQLEKKNDNEFEDQDVIRNEEPVLRRRKDDN